MLWAYPAAAVALVALAAPILIHVLVRQRADRLPFPTLRFIQPHRLASVRRHALEDALLLAVRALVLIAAATAIAGPFLVTAARQRTWDARTIRAEVTDADLHGGLVRGVAWLAAQPPGRREIVVRSPLPLGSITAADVAAVPRNIGLRFERSVPLPPTRTVPVSTVVADGTRIDREAILDADRTSVRDVRSANAPADAVPRALAHERVPAPVTGRSVRLVFAGETAETSPITKAWMADAVASIERDLEGDLELRFGADGDRLVVRADIRMDDRNALRLARSAARAVAAPIEHPADEILPIPDTQLRAWTREPGPAVLPKVETLERDDRRWLWAAVLVLLAVEWRLRRRSTGKTTRVSRAA